MLRCSDFVGFFIYGKTKLLCKAGILSGLCFTMELPMALVNNAAEFT